MIIFIAHYSGCIFFFASNYQYQNQISHSTWIEIQKLVDKDWTEQYISSLYWAVITMITIGFGDIVPISKYDKIIVICISLIGCGVFAYSLNQIGNLSCFFILFVLLGTLVQTITSKDVLMRQKMGKLTRYFNKKGVNQNLQIKVKKYFEYLW